MQHNLPAPLSKRFGRDREIATVGRLLAQARLLTLTGAGGIGKTTLALEVCRSLVASDPRRYPDGIWLVELAPTADQSLVAHTVASATHTPETPDQPATESLIRALRAKQALIVLDNCEHVIGATAELSERLLGQCPSLTILATSREPLNIAGELVWPVPPLPPEDGATLFAARAAEARPDFALTVAQAATVVEMCQQLDGLPLAIELAAATARSLAVEEVASRLGQRFNVLAAGKRTAPQRQQSLRAMVDWSYTRLSPQEQTLFARLSVFAAGWTLAAAEGICADGSDMLGLLHELVQKSLVAAEPRGPETRYRLLETLRQYAAEQLREAGEEAELRTRHLQWFLAFAEGAEPELSGADQFAWNDRVEVEHANIRAALGWARLDGHVEASLRLGAALRLWWLRRVHIVEGCEWLEDLLSKAGGRDGPRVRAKALNALAFLRLRQAQLQAAQRHAEEALKLARQSADQSQEALALVSLGHVERECGDAAASERRLRRALGICNSLGDGRLACYVLIQLGWSAEARGAPGRALELYSKALRLLRDLPEPTYEARALHRAGSAAIDAAQLDVARERFAAALQIQPHFTVTARALAGAAGLAAAEGKAERALRLAGASIGLLRTVASGLQPTEELQLEHRLTPARQALGAKAAAAAVTLGEAMSLDQAVAYALEDLDPGEKSGTVANKSVLSQRELEVAELISQGFTNAHIAARLVISEGTAKRHVENIMTKLGVHARAQIVNWLAGHSSP